MRILKADWVLYDFLGAACSAYVSYRVYVGFVSQTLRVGPFAWAAIFGFLSVAGSYLWELYESQVLADSRKTFGRLFLVSATVGVLSIIANYVLFFPGLGRIILTLTLLGAFVTQWFWRSLWSVLRVYRGPEDLVVVGHGEFAREMCNLLLNSTPATYRLMAVATAQANDSSFHDVRVIDIGLLAQTIPESRVRHVLLVPGEEPDCETLDALIDSMKCGVQFHDARDFYERLMGKIPIRYVDHASFLVGIQSIGGLLFRRIKRILDVVLAAMGIVVTAPLMLLIWLAINLDSGGSVVYRQQRVGLNGKGFSLWKFRTMVREAEKDGPRWATVDDARVTRVGRILRKLRLDELPQLANILLGHMSFVGPRPERPEFVEFLSREIPFYRHRYLVRPGLTGWAQVRYPYGASVEDARHKLEYDLYYIKHQTLLMDLLILGRTISIVVGRTGAR